MTHVLLHGFTGAPGSWSDVLLRMPVRGRVLAPWLAGHGPQPVIVDDFEQEVARLCARVAAEADDGSAHLVGYSMGGRVALGMLAARPELFARATLIGARPGLSDPAERDARMEWERQWLELLELDGIDAFVEAWEALPMWASQQQVADDRLEAQARTRRSHTAHGLAAALRALGLAAMPDLGPSLERLDLPVDVMVGERDTKFADFADRMLLRLPRGRRLTIAGAGHNLLLERPDAVADALNQKAEHD